MAITNWRELIEVELEKTGETFGALQSTLTAEGWDKEFDGGFGGSEGQPFTAWGPKYVYFPVVYDGAEWVGHAPRNPCDEATEHQGGE